MKRRGRWIKCLTFSWELSQGYKDTHKRKKKQQHNIIKLVKEMHQIVSCNQSDYKVRDAIDHPRRYRKNYCMTAESKNVKKMCVKKKNKQTDVPMLLFKVPSA